MGKYTWLGGINDTILDLNVVACRGGMSESPTGLTITSSVGGSIDITADERFMIVLKLNGAWVASLHPSLIK